MLPISTPRYVSAREQATSRGWLPIRFLQHKTPQLSSAADAQSALTLELTTSGRRDSARDPLNPIKGRSAPISCISAAVPNLPVQGDMPPRATVFAEVAQDHLGARSLDRIFPDVATSPRDFVGLV